MSNELKKKLKTRLSKILGQVAGLQKMLEGDKYCIDIITQSQAAKSALSSFESLMLKNHLEMHAAHQLTHGESKKAVQELMKVYNVSLKKK